MTPPVRLITASLALSGTIACRLNLGEEWVSLCETYTPDEAIEIEARSDGHIVAYIDTPGRAAAMEDGWHFMHFQLAGIEPNVPGVMAGVWTWPGPEGPLTTSDSHPEARSWLVAPPNPYFDYKAELIAEWTSEGPSDRVGFRQTCTLSTGTWDPNGSNPAPEPEER